MKNIARLSGIFGIALGLLFMTCSKDEECSDCGKIIEGYLFKKVTEEDFAQFAAVKGIKVDACMQYKALDIVSGEIDENTIEIVDDCCCD